MKKKKKKKKLAYFVKAHIQYVIAYLDEVVRHFEPRVHILLQIIV